MSMPLGLITELDRVLSLSLPSVRESDHV
ncbi:hypothetical protein CGRA01v4_06900 [Colletotrichum graminicola]|nr:hypothetical protein CGRA01v4_06900 [Colletotrichum graminicola]